MAKSYAVLGLGRFGKNVAKALIDANADVLVADKDPDAVNEFQKTAANAIIAELSDERSLRSIGLENVETVIIAMGENLEASIMSAMIAKELGVSTVVAKSSSKRMGDILTKVGADLIIFPEEEAAFRTAKLLMSNTFLDYYDLGKELSLVEMRPKPHWIGKTLRELDLRKNEHLNVVAIREKDGSFVHMSGEIPLKGDSEMLIVAEKNELRKLDQK